LHEWRVWRVDIEGRRTGDPSTVEHPSPSTVRSWMRYYSIETLDELIAQRANDPDHLSRGKVAILIA
jgi:hypothetical protein